MQNTNEPVQNSMDDPELWWRLKREQEEAGTVNVRQATSLSFWSHFKIQLVIAICIFIAFVFVQNIDQKSELQLIGWLEHEINNDTPLTTLSFWYDEHFAGSPAFIPTFDNKSQMVMSKHKEEALPLPVADSYVIRTYADSLTGLELSTPSGAEVLAVAEGRVVFVRDEGDTVIVQHPNNYISIYSKLSQTSVELNQWIKSGTILGKMSQTQQKPLLFYAIKHRNEYIDPLGVISFE